MSVQHVWKEWVKGEPMDRSRSWCLRVFYRGEGESMPTSRDLGGADCLDCLRTIRRTSLWQARENATIAESVVERIDQVERRKVRARNRARRQA